MKKITSKTFLEYQFLSSPVISPNGEYTAFLVHQADIEVNGYHSAIYLQGTKGGEVKKLTTMSEVKSFIWLDDTTILFPSVRQEKVSENETQYYTISIEGGEAQAVGTLDFPVKSMKKISDTQYIVLGQYDNQEASSEGYTVFEEVPFWGNGQGVINRKRNRLYLYDESGNGVPITAPLFEVLGFDVNESYVLYHGSEYDDVRPINGGLYLYEIATGETTCLIEPSTVRLKLVALYGKNQGIIAYGTNPNHGINQNTDVYVLDLKTGKQTFLTAYEESIIGSNSTGSDSRFGGGKGFVIVEDILYFASTSINHSYLYQMDLTTGTVTRLTTKGSVDSIDVVGNQIVMVAMKENQLGELYTLEDGVEKKLTAFNDVVGETYALSNPEPITCVNRDGMEIYGYVMKPVGYVEGNLYPAILHIHGGPKTVFSDIFHNEMQFWANEGYFVFYCNPRGSDGRGSEFSDINGKYGTIDYEDIMDFTDTVLTQYEDIDESRVGVTGGSYGGFMTNWIIGHTDRFRCACAQRSIANWTSFEGTTDIGYYFAPDQTAASHTENQELQWQQSPLRYADQVVTPTLFIHSDEDYRCWMVEVLQMFTALKMKDVPSRICLLKGDNHELSRSGKPRNRVKRMDEIIAWMNHYLK